jgi:5-methylthioadenosine/S-adenosylhomocysteine deaminase
MADIFIRDADWLITVDHDRRILRSGAIAIEGDRIAAVGKTADLEPRFGSAALVISARGKVVLPGLIDSHIHTAFQLSRGLADEVSAAKFLFERMYPYEGLLTEEESYWSAQLCILELLRNGVTTFIDAGNYHPQETIRAVGEAGVRCVIAKSNLDIPKSPFGALPKTFLETTEECLERSEAVVEKWNGAHNGRVRAWFQFRGIPNSTDRLVQGMKQLADRHGVGVGTHACFSRDTLESCKTQFGVTEIERLQRLGALGPNVLLVHSGWISPHELQAMKEHDVKIVCAPSSSLHNGYGCVMMGKIPEFLEMGLAVGLGSDHASSGIVDLVQEMGLCAGAYKEVRLNTGVMPPERVVEMATINGARCALWDQDIGSIEAGKKADITIFNTRTPQWQPLYNPVSNLVYSATGASVDTVLCDGAVLMEGRQLKTLDEEEIFAQVDRLIPGILKKTNLEEKIKPRWPVE